MNEPIKREDAEEAAADSALLTLGQWMGRRESFGLMAGRCSAADIEILRKIRDEKLYEALNCNWNEFCIRHLQVARRTVNREIAYLREYGPAFFTIRQLTHITAADYKQIAPHVTADGVHLEGAVVPLDPQHSQPLAAAIGKLLEKAEDLQPESAASPFDAILKRCRSTTQLLREFDDALAPDQMHNLASEVADLRRAAAGLGVQIWDR